MQRFARIQNGIVAEIIALPDGVDVAQAFHADITLQPCDGSVSEGQTFNGTSFGPAPAAAAPTKAELSRMASGKVAGLSATPRAYTAAGVTVSCDATQGTIADLLALKDWGTTSPTDTAPWVANDGTVTTITGAQAVALANAVGPYRLGLYRTLSTVLGQIASGAITTAAQIDAAAWGV